MGIKVVAMILAGGKGTRLQALTKKMAKPVVTFGGKYKIIDFTLSNCANSGINHVGVLTQYESSEINSYVGDGSSWGLNGVQCLTTVLSPKQTEEGQAWYKGTADAIANNLDWLDALNPEFVLILSGDHIYASTYDEMIEKHSKSGADVTISTIKVPLEEASRFGILKLDDNDKVIEFKEKPKNPTSQLASMGIYVFKYKVLKSELLADAKNEDSSHDFGKDIIPNMLAKKRKVYGYRFNGYWKDVGTLASLHEANMDLLMSESGNKSIYTIIGKNHIYTKDNNSLPQFIGPKASIKDSLVNQGVTVLGNVDRCVISSDVLIEERAKAKNCVIFQGAILRKGCVVENAIIAPNVEIGEKEIINKGNKDIVLVSSSTAKEAK